MIAVPAKEHLLIYGTQMVNVVSADVREDEYDLLPKLRDYMIHTMERFNGMALAAPEVGVYKRYFIIRSDDGGIIDFVNPEVIQLFGYDKTMNEGCLSLPPCGNLCPVTRSEKVRIEFGTASGPETRSIVLFNDMDARAVQHSLDHLYGAFFIGRAAQAHAKKVLNTFSRWKETYAKNHA